MIKINISTKKRMRTSLFIVFLIIMILIGRLGYIQLIDGKKLSKLAFEQQTLDRTINPKRGTIYDSSGKVALATSSSVETITVNNVVKVIGDCIGVFYWNKSVIKYLWDYYKGDQPILYRQKITNEDITNKVVENHAYEIVQFKVGQTYGEPVQFISRKDDEKVNKAVDTLNDFMSDAI